MHIRPIAAGARTTTKSIKVSIALQQGKQDAALLSRLSDRVNAPHRYLLHFAKG
jgi:hypothetical protein